MGKTNCKGKGKNIGQTLKACLLAVWPIVFKTEEDKTMYQDTTLREWRIQVELTHTLSKRLAWHGIRGEWSFRRYQEAKALVLAAWKYPN